MSCGILQKKEDCPKCHFLFIAGFAYDNTVECPKCKFIFISGKKINHSNCTICKNQSKGSDNIWYRSGCPALMSDGHFITYYNSSNELTNDMMKINGFTDPNKFRIFLQNNGKQFMDMERNNVVRQNTCTTSSACSQGWYDLWNKFNGNWSNISHY